MHSKVSYWNLQEGTRDGQMSRDEKIQRGQEYIEILEKQGEVVLAVIEEENRLVIHLQD